MKRKKVLRKQCRDCLRVLPISGFYVKERRPSCTRYFSRCRACFYVFSRRLGRRGAPIIVAGKRLSARQLRVRRLARAAINNAVFRGTIKKPRRCVRCKKITSSRGLHGHHMDYARRFDILWLCQPCHRAEDQKH